MTENRFVLRADVGRSHGLGHLQRTVALAEALEAKDGAPILALVGEEPTKDVFGYRRFQSTIYAGIPGSLVELAWLRDLVEEHRPGAVVVDSYNVNEAYLLSLKETGTPVVMTDDLATMDFPCDLVVGPNAHAEKLPYRGSPTTSFLLGPRFVMLRREFWETSPRVSSDADRLTVLITVGGADPHDLTPQLTVAAVALDIFIRVIVVLGPFFGRSNGTIEASSMDKIEFVSAPASLRPLMESCDIALSSGGQTLYELAAMGIPAISVEVADNQHESLLALAGAGTVIPAGKAGDPALFDNVAEALQRMGGDPSLRAEMSAAGRRLIDGRGALRVAEAVLALAART